MTPRHSPTLRAVPQTAPRVLGLIRVSKERDGMISPEVQYSAISDYCTTRGYVIGGWMEGLDESGSRSKSAWWPRLDQGVAAVEAGEYDVIVVWKFSRTARHRLRWAVAIDRVETAGGRLESATEQFDTTTSAGRFARGMVAEMNAFEAERTGEVWQEAHTRRVRSGLPHSGRAKWGYLYDREEKLHKPHPEQAPVLADMYRRYVAGESMYALARWLNTHGWRTLNDGAWSDRSLRRVMDSGFAAGRFMFRGELHDGVHQAIVDNALWQAYLDARGARRVMPARTERSAYLLSGMVRCANCGGAMTANRVDPGTKLSQRAKGRAEGKRYSAGPPRMTFRCARGRETGRCSGGTVGMAVLEAHVRRHLEVLAARVDAGAAERAVTSARRSLLEVEAQRVARELARVEQALVQLAVRDAENPMPAATYEAARRELEARAVELQQVAEVSGRAFRRSSRDPSADAARLLEVWDELPVAGRREILRGLIDCVLVRPGRAGLRWMRVVEWDEARP